MIIDGDLMFSTAQAITADAGSTNVIDTAPLGLAASAGGSPVNTGRNIGVGESLYIWLNVDVVTAGGGSTAVNLQTDADVAFGSATTLQTSIFAVPNATAAGTRYFARLPIGTGIFYERYIRLFYDVTGTVTGSVSAGIIKDIDSMMPEATYVGGYTNAAG